MSSVHADPAPRPAVETAVFPVILAISACQLLNDMMQSLLPAIYPNLKASLGLSFSQIGMGGLGAGALGEVADIWGIETVYSLCAYLPAIGLLAAWLPNLRKARATA